MFVHICTCCDMRIEIIALFSKISKYRKQVRVLFLEGCPSVCTCLYIYCLIDGADGLVSGYLFQSEHMVSDYCSHLTRNCFMGNKKSLSSSRLKSMRLAGRKVESLM